jgi:hypothetical protein
MITNFPYRRLHLVSPLARLLICSLRSSRRRPLFLQCDTHHRLAIARNYCPGSKRQRSQQDGVSTPLSRGAKPYCGGTAVKYLHDPNVLTFPPRPKRPSPLQSRGSRTSTPERDISKHREMASPPSTPRPYVGRDGDIVMGSTAVLVPPSPGFLNGKTHLPVEGPTVPVRDMAKMQITGKHRTSAGVKKTQTKSRIPVRKVVKTTAGMAGVEAVFKPFRFMSLPGGKLSSLSSRLFTMMSILTPPRDPQHRLPPHLDQVQASTARAPPTHGLSASTHASRPPASAHF